MDADHLTATSATSGSRPAPMTASVNSTDFCSSSLDNLKATAAFDVQRLQCALNLQATGHVTPYSLLATEATSPGVAPLAKLEWVPSVSVKDN